MVDICAILEKSKDLGISSLEVLGLKVTFYEPKTGPRRNAHYSAASRKDGPQAGPESPQAAEPETTSEQDEDFREAALMNSEALEDARIAQLMIDDPVAYERHMLDESLERERTLAEGQSWRT